MDTCSGQYYGTFSTRHYNTAYIHSHAHTLELYWDPVALVMGGL